VLLTCIEPDVVKNESRVAGGLGATTAEESELSRQMGHTSSK